MGSTVAAVSSPPRVELLTHQQAADFLGIAHTSLYSRAFRQRAGLPEPLKVGRFSRWTREQLEDFVRRQVQGAA